MKTEQELIKDIEQMKKDKWEVMPKRIKAYQEYQKKKQEFDKLWHKERWIEKEIYLALQKLEENK